MMKIEDERAAAADDGVPRCRYWCFDLILYRYWIEDDVAACWLLIDG